MWRLEETGGERCRVSLVREFIQRATARSRVICPYFVEGAVVVGFVGDSGEEGEVMGGERKRKGVGERLQSAPTTKALS